MRGQERIKLKRDIDEPMRTRKVSNLIISMYQQNLEMNNTKTMNNQNESQLAKKSIETQMVNNSEL
jgi:hypothetical protein